MIEHVSRFRPAAEQRDAIKRFSEGKVDCLIGTHRLLSRDVRAKDLGLLIVDEEQRFGVKQKELLRQLKLKVDVIAMSATPIPRTLQMSLAGLRDISVIETPPEGRRPIKTYVGEYDEQLVKQALEREKARGGQAFFLHNRVEDIDEVAERLRALCPGMRFIVAPRPARAATSSRSACSPSCAATPTCCRHHDHRVRHRHPAGQHADRRPRRRLRPQPALPDPRPRRPVPRARLRVPAVPERGRADRGGRQPPGGAVGLHRARRRLQDRHARPRAARRRQPARRRAVRPRRRARLRALHADARRGRRPMDAEEGGGRRGPARARPPRRQRRRLRARPTTSPTSRPRSTSTAGSSAAREVADLEELRDELDRPLRRAARAAREPAHAPAGAHQARPGRRHRPSPSRPGRLAVTPIELDSVRAKKLRAGARPGALYESGKSQFSMRVPDDPEQRFPAVVAGRRRAARRAARGRVIGRGRPAGDPVASRRRASRSRSPGSRPPRAARRASLRPGLEPTPSCASQSRRGRPHRNASSATRELTGDRPDA